MLDLGRKPSEVISVIFYIQISKNCKRQVFPPCDDYFQWVSTTPSIAIARNDRSVGSPLYAGTPCSTGAVVEWPLLCAPYYSISREGEKVVCLCLRGWCKLCDGSTWYWQVPLCEALLWGTSKFIHDFSDQWAVVNPNVTSL